MSVHGSMKIVMKIVGGCWVSLWIQVMGVRKSAQGLGHGIEGIVEHLQKSGPVMKSDRTRSALIEALGRFDVSVEESNIASQIQEIISTIQSSVINTIKQEHEAVKTEVLSKESDLKDAMKEVYKQAVSTKSYFTLFSGCKSVERNIFESLVNQTKKEIDKKQARDDAASISASQAAVPFECNASASDSDTTNCDDQLSETQTSLTTSKNDKLSDVDSKIDDWNEKYWIADLNEEYQVCAQSSYTSKFNKCKELWTNKKTYETNWKDEVKKSCGQWCSYDAYKTKVRGENFAESDQDRNKEYQELLRIICKLNVIAQETDGGVNETAQRECETQEHSLWDADGVQQTVFEYDDESHSKTFCEAFDTRSRFWNDAVYDLGDDVAWSPHLQPHNTCAHGGYFPCSSYHVEYLSTEMSFTEKVYNKGATLVSQSDLSCPYATQNHTAANCDSWWKSDQNNHVSSNANLAEWPVGPEHSAEDIKNLLKSKSVAEVVSYAYESVVKPDGENNAYQGEDITCVGEGGNEKDGCNNAGVCTNGAYVV